jgi:hypothetical protein
VHFRPFRSLSAAAVSSFLLLGLVSSASAAGEKDKEALKLHDQAINEDYLNADFPKAIGKLKDALKKCGTDGCTPAVVAKIHVSLGTIYGLGNGKLDQAKDEFVLGLKADPAVTVDSALTNPDLDKAFAEAKKSAGGGAAPAGTGGTTGGTKKPPAGDGEAGTHKAPPEQAVNTPVPIYMEPSEEQPVSKVTLRYKPFGSKTYKSAELKKMGKGFGGEIPCEDVTTTGDIKYFFALTDESGEAAGTLGTTKDPYKVTIKSEIEGEAPTLPGQKAPDQCKEKVDCPPGLPGCPAAGSGGGAGGGKRGDKGWGASCEETQQCSEGLVCLNGACEEGKDDGTGGPKDKDKKGAKRNLVSLGIELDWLIVGSQDNVCSPEAAGSYACFLSGTSTQFDGTIVTKGGTNGVVGGGSFGDVRVLLGYERQLVASIPLTLGVRLGWAFGGSPSPENAHDAPDGTSILKSGRTAANSFLGFHGEARASYYFLGMFEKMKLRPYAFVGGGLAQVNASVPIKVCDASSSTGTSCGTKSRASKGVDIDAYQITGLNFIGFGAGTTFGITPSFGIAAEVKMMIMVPTSGFVVAPTFGPVLAF